MPPRTPRAAARPNPDRRLTADLLKSPELFPRQLDFARRLFILARMSRQTYADSTFLDERTIASEPGATGAPFEAVRALCARHARPGIPVNLLFHTALCGSTLISRCLELPGKSFALKEPGILHAIACVRRDLASGRRQPIPIDHTLLDRALEVSAVLLSRTWQPGEIALIKPSDTCANLISPLAGANPNARALLLYHRIDDFCVAMLKSDQRREYLRAMLPRAARDLAPTEPLDSIDAGSLPDAHAAAYVWLSLMRPYRDATLAHPDRVRTLDAARFFADPPATLASIASFYRLNLADREIDKIISGPAFATDSKDPSKTFDHEAYQARRQAQKAELAEEIASARAWIDRHASHTELADDLPAPLEA